MILGNDQEKHNDMCIQYLFWLLRPILFGNKIDCFRMSVCDETYFDALNYHRIGRLQESFIK